MLPTFIPPVAPSPGTGIANKIALNKTSFGDGYSQASPRGLNHVRREISLRWDALTLEQARQIENFLRERGGFRPFRWAVRGDASPSVWTCETWNRTDGAPASVTATFVEWFGNSA